MKSIITWAATLLLFSSAYAVTPPTPPTDLSANACIAQIPSGGAMEGNCNSFAHVFTVFDGWGAAHIAAYYGNAAAMQQIIDMQHGLESAGFIAEGTRWHGLKPLAIAEMRGYTSLATLIKSSPFVRPITLSPPSSTDAGFNGYSACARAIILKDIEFALDDGCMGYLRLLRNNQDGWSFVGLASAHDNIEFINRSAVLTPQAFRPMDTSGQAGDGYTPMAIAMALGHDDIADLLYQVGHPKLPGYTPSASTNAVLHNGIREGDLYISEEYSPVLSRNVKIYSATSPFAIASNRYTPAAIINYAVGGETSLHLLMSADRRGEEYKKVLDKLLRNRHLICAHSGVKACDTDSIHASGNPVIRWINATPSNAVPTALASSCSALFPFGSVGESDDTLDCIKSEDGVVTSFDSTPVGGGLHRARVEFDYTSEGFDRVVLECDPYARIGQGMGCFEVHAMAGVMDDYSTAVDRLCEYSNYSGSISAGYSRPITLASVLGEDDDKSVGCTFWVDAPFRVRFE